MEEGYVIWRGGVRVLTFTVGDRIGPDKLHASGGYAGEVSVTV